MASAVQAWRAYPSTRLSKERQCFRTRLEQEREGAGEEQKPADLLELGAGTEGVHQNADECGQEGEKDSHSLTTISWA